MLVGPASTLPFYPSINDGPIKYKAPRYNMLCTILVNKENTHPKKLIASEKQSSSVDECSIGMNGCIDAQNRSLLNIIVSPTFTPCLLREIDY